MEITASIINISRYTKEVHSSSSCSSKRSTSAVEKKSKRKSHQKYDSQKFDLMMPCDSISTASSEGSVGYGRKGRMPGIMMLDGSVGDKLDLETEVVDFRDHTPKFNNSVELQTKKDHEMEMAQLIEQFPSFKNKLGLKNLIGGTGGAGPSHKQTVNTASASSHTAWNGELYGAKHEKNGASSKKDKEKGKKRRSNQSLTSDEDNSFELHSHVMMLESQIHNQVLVN